ncbi:hypothetical protein [Flavobacterium sp.]|uniref:hypothetical protein n=1 Tax=Flavobacterium sp. TaxID=239 RepID=UPI00286DD91E|nr:hypothetical protein [Flavobacterium sp.]
MRNFIIYLALVLCSFVSKIYAQDTFESKARTIANTIEKITRQEKETLKVQIEEVNIQLDKKTISNQDADAKKLELATQCAIAIETKIALEEAKLTELVKQKVEGKLANTEEKHKDRRKHISIYYGDDTHKNDSVGKTKSEKRTTSQFVFATGINNLVTDDKISNSDFRYLGSHFYEWGITYNTRLAKNNNVAHMKYGVSVMYNNLRATDNRYFQTVGNVTSLTTSAINLKDSRFRNVNIVVPVHFELDFSKTKIANDEKIFNSHKGFRLGLGGFAGVNVKTKQITKYNDAIGNSVETKSKGNYNVSDFVYGLSTYIGYSETSLYLKYDLNTLFENNVTNQNNISLGLRWDFN